MRHLLLNSKIPNHTILALSVLIASTPTLAMDNSAFDGPYVGFSFGGTQMQADVDNDNIGNSSGTSGSTPFSVTVAADYSLDDYQSSWIAALRLGYGKGLGSTPFYLGAELFGDVANRENNETTTSSSAPSFSFMQDSTVQLNNGEYGADIKPGILLSSLTLLYARVGAAFNKITLDAPTLIESSRFILQDSADNVVGLRLGLGLETSLAAAWSITADYIYTNYGSTTASTTSAFNPSPNPGTTVNILQTEATADVATQAILLGINYYPLANRNRTQQNTNFIASDRISGFYAGVKGGGLLFNAQSNVFFEGVALNTVSNDNDLNLWDNGALGEIVLGYGQLLNQFSKHPFYLGIEMFGNLADRELQATNTSSFDTHSGGGFGVFLDETTQITLNELEWGGDLKFGPLFSNDVLLYARVGFAINEIQANTDDSFTFVVNGERLEVPIPLNVSSQESESVVGLRLGLGLEKMLWRGLSVTADYIFTTYGGINMAGSSSMFIPLPIGVNTTVSNETDVDDIHTHAGLLGLAWHL